MLSEMLYRSVGQPRRRMSAVNIRYRCRFIDTIFFLDFFLSNYHLNNLIGIFTLWSMTKTIQELSVPKLTGSALDRRGCEIIL